MNTVLFIPSIESHYYNFLPLLEDKNLCDAKLLIIEDVIHKNRIFPISKSISNKTVYLKNYYDTIHFINTFRKDRNIISIVGNDSEPEISKILRKFKILKIKRILLQDGWLDSRNILSPIYTSKSKFIIFKKVIHKLIVSHSSPLKKYFHNFIGQNSDYYFVYSEIAKQEFIKAGVLSSQIIITGSPRFQLFKNVPIGEKKAVIFFSTAEPSDIEYRKAIYKSLSKVIEITKEIYGDTVQIVLKCHPREDQSQFKNINGLTLHNGDIVSLISNYNPIFAYCFNSTVIFELMVKQIPFLQLIPHPFTPRDANYHIELPYLVNLNNIIEKQKEAQIYDYNKEGKKLLLDIKSNYNSTKTIVKILSYNL